jgi:hypothetical protein
MEIPTDRPASAPVAAAARRVVFGFGVREIGIGALAIAVLAAAGVWFHKRWAGNERELAAIRTELALKADAAEVYREHFAEIQDTAVQLHAWAESQNTEPVRTWARERVRRYDALVDRVDQEETAQKFAAIKAEVEELCARGEIAAAQAKLSALPELTFPVPTEFSRLKHDVYEVPIAQFSRQNPDFYRALHDFEPAAAKQDEAALRGEITRSGDAVTPQLMLKVDLLAAVAPSDDPVVSDWSALASAMDYFDGPDADTLAHWRRTQHALQAKDYQTAANEMQAIAISKVRTRQPFRAAFGRVLLKCRPDQPGEAYPYLVEAASAGDKQARLWVAQQDVQQKRYAQARRWLEAGVADGDGDSIPVLLQLYEQHIDEMLRDPLREAGTLERITDRPDAPADAWLMLGRLYERDDPRGSSKGKAFGCYQQAAAKGSAKGQAEVARCALEGAGTPQDLDLARDAACAAFAAGARAEAVPVLIELMRKVPARSAGAIAQLFGHEDVHTAVPYTETTTVVGPGVAQLKSMLAQYFDQIGKFGAAARFYGGANDGAAMRRHGELTAVHVCATCGGTGKVDDSAPCPTCGGTGRQICSFCGGSGFIYVPGVPPCPTCGGSGTMMQDRKLVACAACGGSGKGKGSVIKQDCSHCEHGYIRCPDCINGSIKITKECPDCHGHGTWTMADRATE